VPSTVIATSAASTRNGRSGLGVTLKRALPRSSWNVAVWGPTAMLSTRASGVRAVTTEPSTRRASTGASGTVSRETLT
jgi:hypothetical protein